ncbi:MAG: penicillin-binding transpeptidase domain-containing protein [Desulfobulbaceae bacterium]|nr:penicillin-binding transpeptidase domain-containing protein [Desulfobulbaceae bacterium]
MTRSVRKIARKKKRFHAVAFFVILSAAVGAGLYRLPPSLLDVGRFFRLAADRFSSQSADILSAEAVLRGTIFDRNLNELAVSYQLYSLFIRPSEIVDRPKIAADLSRFTGQEAGELEIRLRSGSSQIRIAENLDRQQVEGITALQLKGVYFKPVAERFYPGHEVAAALLGYTEDGLGLTGIEAMWDTVLQRSNFRASSIPEIDFKDTQVLGNTKLDIILTLDQEIQKEIEQRLREYLQANGAGRGQAVVMNARTGAVLAWADMPSFNPNYFWQIPGTMQKSAGSEGIDEKLFEDMLVRAAAVRKKVEPGEKLLPPTVAAENFGLQESEIRQFGEMIGLGRDFTCRLPDCADSGERIDTGGPGAGEIDNISPLQFVTAAAGLLNGGWKVQPYVLDSIYDETHKREYERSKEYEAAERRRIMSPFHGVMVRMNLPSLQKAGGKDLYLHAGSVNRIIPQGDLSRYVMQDMMIGAIPVKSPEYVVFMVSWRDSLNPLPDGIDRRYQVAELGEKILPAAYSLARREQRQDRSIGHDPSNYNRFLISRRIDYQDPEKSVVQDGPVMPLVTGLSLRKGLQRLNAYNLTVKVEGSGRIVNQRPESGNPLNNVGECTLILESKLGS